MSEKTPSTAPENDRVSVRRDDLVWLLTEYQQPPQVLERLWAAVREPAYSLSENPPSPQEQRAVTDH